jgi:hypothetical protein
MSCLLLRSELIVVPFATAGRILRPPEREWCATMMRDAGGCNKAAIKFS